MANSYSKIYIHVVFAVKGRENVISKNWKEDLYKYICGIVNNKNEKVYAINVMSDHIHILLSIKPNCLLSDLIRDIKANSSKWVNSKNFIPGKFQWQEGAGSFSVSHQQLDLVIGYIGNQETHHQKRSFKAEYLELLKTNDVEYDERYAFGWEE
jgi:putative transposase